MDGLVSSEQQAALDALGVTRTQFIFYHASRVNGRYLTNAVATLLIYDFLITLGEEVQHIWKTTPRFSVVKGLWYLNRYWPLAGVCVRIWAMVFDSPPPIMYVACCLPSDYWLNTRPSCNFALPFTEWSAIFNIAVVDIILMVRVWALYGSRVVKWILIGLAAVGLSTAIALRKAPPITGLPLVTPAPESLAICPRSSSADLFSLFTLSLAVETFIFGMLIYRASNRPQSSLRFVLVRDGALYYAAITCGPNPATLAVTYIYVVVLAFMIASTFIPTLFQPVADAYLNIPLSSLACNRLFLSLRSADLRGRDVPDDSGIPTHSSTTANHHPIATFGAGGKPSHRTTRSHDLSNDFQLRALRSLGRQRTGSMDLVRDQETDNTRDQVERIGPASATGHSEARAFTSVPPAHGTSSPGPSPTSAVPPFTQVTGTGTRRE